MFLKSCLAAGGALALGDRLFARYDQANVWPLGETPYGPTAAARAIESGETLLTLPPGFNYRVVSAAPRTMSDGVRLPPSLDGAAAFEVGGFIRLVRNHELQGPGRRLGEVTPYYDAKAQGGTTTAIIDPVTRTLVRDFVSLSGTLHNCSGGATPWGSWISCEENTWGPERGFDQPHGYCFEVPADAERPVEAKPIKAMGRFLHEAVAVDSRTGIVYMTEDSGSAGFYRYVPHVRGNLAAGGKLQMLAVNAQPGYDFSGGQPIGRSWPVVWVDITDPDPPFGGSEPQPVYRQGRNRGAAKFRRLEGAAYRNGEVLFTSTTGGAQEMGQLWRYTPLVNDPAGSGARRRSVPAPRRRLDGEPGGELTLLYESPDAEKLKAPDNIAIRHDGMVAICSDAPNFVQSLRIYTPNGDLFELARNLVFKQETSEFAGAAWSPDGATLFVNVYGPAITFAIWGRW